MSVYYIAYESGNLSQNSGQKLTREEAETWAKGHMAKRPQAEQTFIAEVIGTVRRTTPPIEVVDFRTQPKSSPSHPANVGHVGAAHGNGNVSERGFAPC